MLFNCSYILLHFLWSLKIPNSPHWPLTIMASESSPYTDGLHHSVSSQSVSWCIVCVLEQYGCRHIIQVDAAHWWWTRKTPSDNVECLEKALYKCNELL